MVLLDSKEIKETLAQQFEEHFKVHEKEPVDEEAP